MNQTQNQVVKKESNQIGGSLTINECWSMAKLLATSTIVPKEYQNNPANCFVALEMSQRMGASPMMVMQNLYTINGRPSWSSPFIISAINTCGRFKTPLQYKLEGSGDGLSCYAFAISNDGTLCTGPTITMKMASAEGWVAKNGSKWKTMPEVMIRYRAAAFFGRQHAPELLMGMHSVEEAIELSPSDFSVVEEKVQNEIKTNANTGEIVDVSEKSEQKEEKQETKAQEETKQPEQVVIQAERIVVEQKPQQQSLFAEQQVQANTKPF